MKNISMILFAIFGCLLMQTDAAVIKASTVAPGYNSNDATACFVNAIDTAAKPGDTVVFDKVGTGVWRIKGRYPSFFDCNKNTPNNITVIVEPGVTIFGIDGTYTGSHRLNMLWRWENCDRIKILGYGATLKMNKNACCESGGESMHNLAFYDCSNIHIEGLYIDGSGGDGVYFGTRTETGLCRNIVMKNIVATNHRRQGMTITSLENGHIEDCAFLSTSGAPPNAGIDFEPNHPTNRLINIRVNNCFFNKNHYNGLAFHMSKLLSSPHAISVTLHDTFVVDNWRETPGREDQGYVKAELATGGGPAKGLIEFNRVMFADSRYGGIRNYKHHDRYKLVFNDAVFEGLGRQGGVEKPIELHRYNYRDTPGRPSMGNMEFNGLFVREDRNIPFMEINSADGAPLEDFVVKDCLVVSPNTVGILDTDGVRKNPPASQKISYNLEKTMPSQTVTLVATRATAVRGGQAGSVTVTRTGAKNFPLAVRYTVGGPAKNFDDFDALHGFVIIPTNEASAVISVKARAQSASSTHVTLTLKAHEDYTVGAQNVARVDIGATGVTAAPTTTPEPATTADPNDKQAPSIVSFKVFDITSTSFRVNFTMSEPSSAGIEFGETTAYGTVGTSEKTFRYQTHVQTVKNLKPATTYHWRIFNVSDAAGNKAAPGPDQTTTTLGDGETTSPTTTSVADPTTTTATKATPAQQTSTSATTTTGTATVNLYGCIKGANGCECDAAGNCIADTLECSQLSSTVQRCVEVGCEERGSCHSCTKGKLGCECRDGEACDSELTCAKVSDTRSICVEPLVVSATSSIVLSFGVALTVFVSLVN